MIGRYCHLQLTKATDKLPAIAGIAQQVGRTRPNARYLAGLWSDTLAQDLLWNFNNGGRLGEPYDYKELPTPYRAPSWSWAAVEGHVRVPYPSSGGGRREIMASILECVCNYVDDNPFSKVLSGHLKVLGTLHRCQADIFKENNTWCVRARANAPLLRELMPDYEWGSAYFGRPGIKLGTELHLLRWAKDKHWIYYFVLWKTEHEDGSFRRIGFLLINHYEESKKRGVHRSHDRIEAQVFEDSTIRVVTIV